MRVVWRGVCSAADAAAAAQKLEWKASYTARKAAERRERPNSVPNGGPPQRPAVASPAKLQEQQEGVRFAPGTVVAFSLGAFAQGS